jgi:hypothetical protein
MHDSGEFYFPRGTDEKAQAIHEHDIDRQSHILIQIHNFLLNLHVLGQNGLWLVPDCFPFYLGNVRVKCFVSSGVFGFGDRTIGNHV